MTDNKRKGTMRIAARSLYDAIDDGGPIPIGDRSYDTLTYDSRRSSTYSVDLYEIMDAIRRMPYHSCRHDPQQVEHALHSLFTDKDLTLKIFTDPHLVDHICRVSNDFKKERLKIKEEKDSQTQSQSGITHEDYDTAVDIVDEFVEMGLSTLDAGQTEVYEENLELIEKYENS